MRHMCHVVFNDVKDCFLRIPSNIVKDEEFAKLEYGTSGTSYFSVVRGQHRVDAAIELNSSYAKDLSITEHEVVAVTFIRTLPKLSSVNCTHSKNELEVLELSKDRLEARILQQIRVVWPGQTFPVWIGKNFSCDIQVESLGPPCSVGILCEGTLLDLRPRSNDKGGDDPKVGCHAPSFDGSIKFRACQMPRSVQTRRAGACVCLADWPAQWPPDGLWCRVSRPESEVSVQVQVECLGGDPLGPCGGALNLPLPNILLPGHVLAALGLKGNGWRVVVNMCSAAAPQPTSCGGESEAVCPSPLISGPFVSLVEEGVASLELGLRLTRLAKTFNCSSWLKLSHNILVFGPQGSGKSTIANEIAHRVSGVPYFVHVSTVSCRGLVGKRPDVCGKILKESLDECLVCQPSVLLLDDLDCLAARMTTEDATPEGVHSARISEVVSRMVWSAVQGGNMHQVVVMATALSPSHLSDLLVPTRGAHVFSTLLAIPELDIHLRGKMLAAMLAGWQQPGDEESLQEICQRTAGYVAVDLVDLLERATFDALRRTSLVGSPCRVTPRDLESALGRTRPLSLHGLPLVEGGQQQQRGALWSGVGGLQGAKRKLEEVVLWPLKYHRLFEGFPLKPRQGLLLYGPPGVGKTHLVSSMAGHCGIRLIVVKGPELLSKYIGASEEAIRNIFQKAQCARPSVLFFDEFESLAPRRGHDSTGVTDRVVNQLLTQLDGVEGGVAGGVAVVAATTRPDLVDPALLRPGRLGTPLLCPMPTEGDRESILKELGRQLLFHDDVDLGALAKLTLGFSGADLQALLYTSQVAALKSSREHFSGGEESLNVVQWKDIVTALQQTKPSLTKVEVERYETRYSATSEYCGATVPGVKVSLA